jgi:hypothetical protein
MPLSLIIDVLVAVLLVVTIGYAVMLNKRLGSLRRDKGELERLVAGFADTTARAETGISELRSMADILQERLKRAESLRDDLVFLMERGNATADRLEGVVRDARGQGTGELTAESPAKAAAPSTSAKTTAPDHDPQRKPLSADPTDRPTDRPATDEVSEAERELLKALRSAG